MGSLTKLQRDPFLNILQKEQKGHKREGKIFFHFLGENSNSRGSFLGGQTLGDTMENITSKCLCIGLSRI